MQVPRNRILWISLAVGSATALAVYQWRRAARRRWTGRLSNDRGQYIAWRFDRRYRVLPSGKTMRLELSSPAVVHWSVNQWDQAQDTRTIQVAPGLHSADLPTENLAPGARIQFTFYWPEVNRWEGEDFEVRIEEDAHSTTAPLASGS